MIHADPGPAAAPTPARWQDALREAVRSLPELAELLDLPPNALRAWQPAAHEFPLLVPRGFVARMRKGDAADPLLLQVLPQTAERTAVAGFGADPLREAELAAGGVLRKYRGRALLIATGACPVHCRYCFRRAFPYGEQLAARGAFEPALRAIAADASVREVILSGGDPLSLSNERLRQVLTAVAALPAVRTLRIHTRFPVVLPERVDEGLCRSLRATRLKTVVVVHANHANELDAPTGEALRRLRRAVDCLLNQSVLLKGVNDDVAVLATLSERLFAFDVLPYYLHMLDPVAGAAHFQVSGRRARALLTELRKVLPGYLVPRLVREIPGELSKTPIA